MKLLFFGVLALIPGLLWLRYFYRKDPRAPEPLQWVALTFAIGALSVLPASWLESLLQNFWAQLAPSPYWFFLLLNFFLNVGPVEECFKFGVVFYLIYQRARFDEPMDGMIYASAAAIGFATAENVIYMFTFGWQVLIFRGFLTTLAHIVFASLWGMALGQAPYEPPEQAKYLVTRGLLIAIFIHALYDFLLMANLPGSLLFLLILMTWLWWQIQRWLTWASSVSPHISAADLFQNLNLTSAHPDPAENLTPQNSDE